VKTTPNPSATKNSSGELFGVPGFVPGSDDGDGEPVAELVIVDEDETEVILSDLRARLR
jgi:hypothetical protein